jgi:hypothetical protein
MLMFLRGNYFRLPVKSLVMFYNNVKQHSLSASEKIICDGISDPSLRELFNEYINKSQSTENDLRVQIKTLQKLANSHEEILALVRQLELRSAGTLTSRGILEHFFKSMSVFATGDEYKVTSQ